MATLKIKAKKTAQAAVNATEEKKATTAKATTKAKATDAKAKVAKQNAQLDQKNAEAEVKKITNKKDLKYKYPKDADDLRKRKKFRAEVRGTLRRLEKEIKKLEVSKLPEDMELCVKKTEELERYMRKHLTMN